MINNRVLSYSKTILSKVIQNKRKPDLHDPELHLYSEGEEDIDDPNDPAYQKNDDDQDCELSFFSFLAESAYLEF